MLPDLISDTSVTYVPGSYPSKNIVFNDLVSTCGKITCRFIAPFKPGVFLLKNRIDHSYLWSVYNFIMLCKTSKILLVLSALCLLNGASIRLVAAPAVTNQIELRGVMVVGSNIYGSFFDKLNGLGMWHQAGAYVGEWRVNSITMEEAHVENVKTGEKGTIPLIALQSDSGSAHSIDSSATLGVEPYTKEWINSKANPMLVSRVPLPMDIALGWANLTDKEKAEITDYYKKYGWQLLYTEQGIGPPAFVWKNIYMEDRMKVIQENHQKFTASLSKEQLQMANQLRNAALIFPKGGQLTEAQEAELSARRKLNEEFLRSLSTTQRSDYESINDFTKADWSQISDATSK